MRHASIVPLIGGETLGAMNAYGTPPEYFLSYSPFKSNDQHIVNHFDNDIPYILLDEGGKAPSKVDIIHTVCPCAGLSQLSHGYGDHNENNKWMLQTANYVLEELRPKVFWGENAPGLGGTIGKNIRKQLQEIGKKNGYTMSIFMTKSQLHGLSQVRTRSFYFFWQDERVPIFNYYFREYEKIEDTLLKVKSNTFMEPINKKTPSKDDPYYKFVLEYVHNGMTHRQFFEQLKPLEARGCDMLGYIEKLQYNYKTVGEWMAENNYPKEVDKCSYRYEKLKAGGQIMRRTTIVPKDRIGAFVGHYPTSLTHPHEDRYITYREAMSIMGLPENFELLDPEKNTNHICQNVPVQTATDMATEVKKYLNNELEMVDTDYVIQYNQSRKYEANTRESNLESFF